MKTAFTTINPNLAKKGCYMRVFDIFPSNELDNLLVMDSNDLYCYRRVANTLTFVTSL